MSHTDLVELELDISFKKNNIKGFYKPAITKRKHT